MPRYSVGIYNAEVRALVAMGDHHRQLNDSWADIHYFEISADSPDHARLRMQQRHPPELGYIIADITEGD